MSCLAPAVMCLAFELRGHDVLSEEIAILEAEQAEPA